MPATTETIWSDGVWSLVDIGGTIYLKPEDGDELCSIQGVDILGSIDHDRGDHEYWRSLAERGVIRAGHVVNEGNRQVIHGMLCGHPMGVLD